MELIFEIIWVIVVEVFGKYVTDSITKDAMVILKRSKFMESFFSVIGYIIFGSIVGYVSMLVFPNFLLKNHSLQIANLVFIPIISALIICFVGNWRKKLPLFKIEFEIFISAYVFAFAVSLIRYCFLDVTKPFW
ncbi:hypothetical protein [Leptospira saintgironsiae]|uniref:Uncharacterized protein n=1 Tax=Leptospira saintgironsiae TaxID=2023183 RepID=A0A2M9Y7A1_9LEPT|nr:hypothetical protein [Leptospira saintgironsiae]PJZ47455.1 hypothetical protein CH362_19130 [Leptospira saintgironsiae]